MIFDEGIFDESYLEGLLGNGSYTLDIILEAAALPVVHQADLVIDQTKSLIVHQADLVIDQTKSLIVHQADLVIDQTKSLIVHQADLVIDQTKSLIVHQADLVIDQTKSLIVHQADLVIDQTKSLSFYVGMSGYSMLRSLAVDTILTHERNNQPEGHGMIFDEGIFDESYLEGLPGNGSYTLDIILEAAALPVVHQADLVIDQTKSLSFYVGMSGYSMLRSLAVDTILTHERNNPKFSETIINAIVWSYGQEVEALVDAISTMGLRLMLPDATTSDMDLYWSKILALKRRYDESDSDFRSRLSTRLSIMKSSGTKPECEAIINHILGRADAADIKTYWPGEIEVTWKSPTAMKLAESKYPELAEALDNMVAAGVTWSTRFPYKDSWADICLSGDHIADMTADINVLGRRQWPFMTTVDLFDAGSAINEADICSETSHFRSEPVDMHLISKNRKLLLLDIANEASQVMDQLSDIIQEKLTAKSQSIDVLCMKAQHDYFQVDHISEKPKYKTLLVAMELT